MNARGNLRIVWAIASKDIVDAIRNKTTLSTILSVLFLVVFYRLMPAWESGDTLPRLAIYDAGGSSLAAQLKDSTEFDLIETSSQENMIAYVGNKDIVVMGLTLPVDFDQLLASGEELELQGYAVHWATDAATAEVRAFFEQHLSELTGKPVALDIDGNIVHTQKDSRGFAFLASVSFILVLAIIGLSMVPNLMIEEKRVRTMDALLVSPARAGHIAVGKAIAGLFYCLTAAALVAGTYTALITHWWLAALAVVCGSLFTVSLGLLLGSTLRVKQQVMLWAWLLLIPLLMPVFLVIATDLFPAGLIAALRWVPTVALSSVFRVSFAETAPLAHFGPELALVVSSAALALAAVAWVVRRSDR